MQHYSHPEVFLCPYYNFPGVANPKMHISEEGFDRPPRLCPASQGASAQGLRVLTVTPTSATAKGASEAPSSSRNNSLCQGSERERKAEAYERMFEELIDTE